MVVEWRGESGEQNLLTISCMPVLQYIFMYNAFSSCPDYFSTQYKRSKNQFIQWIVISMKVIYE